MSCCAGSSKGALSTPPPLQLQSRLPKHPRKSCGPRPDTGFGCKGFEVPTLFQKRYLFRCSALRSPLPFQPSTRNPCPALNTTLYAPLSLPSQLSLTPVMPQPPPIVLTVATSQTKALAGWVRSMNRFNFVYRILGLGEEFEGWSWRARKYLQALHSLPSNQLVILCDAYDLLARRDSAGLQAAFDQLHADVVAGAEYCHTDNKGLLDAWYHYHQRPQHSTVPHLNAGFVMGRVAPLIAAYNFVQQYSDDQVALGAYFCMHPQRTVLDFGCRLVINYADVGTEADNEAFFEHYPGSRSIYKQSRQLYRSKLQEAMADEVNDKVKDIVREVL